MDTHDLVQGSQAWLAYRATHFNASDAPAMLGCSPYKTRAELLREMHTGVVADVDAGTQKRFDNGHRAEALARPLAEEFIGAELYPVTGSVGKLSASFDGLTLEERESFEHKALNAELRKAFAQIETIAPAYREQVGCRELPLQHRVQMEQQLLISGAERCLFMASQWTADDELVEEQHCWYYPDHDLRNRIVAGWEQFERDLAAFELPPVAAPAPVGKAPESLPALFVHVTGQVTASNIDAFKAIALGAIRSVNRNLVTDADFADADKARQWCADVETKTKAAREAILGQTGDIDVALKALDDINAEARTVRLSLEKLSDKRKLERKEEIVVKARQALQAHVAAINAELSPLHLLTVTADFAGAIKSLRSFDSMQAALDTTLASGKIAADEQARGIRANAATFAALATGHDFLFSDLSALVHKPAADFAVLVKARIDTHKAAEAEKERKRQAEEDARVAAAETKARADEAARIEREQAAAAAEAARLTAEAAAVPQQASFVPPAPPLAAISTPIVAPIARSASPVAQPDEPATLKLGEICARLGITMTAAYVADTLGIKPARIEGAARLFRESDFDRICAAHIAHVQRVQAQQRERVAALETA